MSRVSVFVDGENISANHAGHILTAARTLGQVDWARVYGDAGLLRGWDDIAEFRLIHSGTGKNAADLLLTVEAMARALGGACDAVVIASSDGDFRHLAGHLKERGLIVMGMGQERAGMRFKARCSRFVVLRGDAPTSDGPVALPDQRPAPAAPCAMVPDQAPPDPGPAGRVANLTRKIVDTIALKSPSNEGLALSELQAIMYRQHRVAISHYPEKTWRGYLQARPRHFALDPKGPNAKVRLRDAARIAAE